MAETRSRDAHEKRLRRVRSMRESEETFAQEAIDDGLTQGEVAFLLGRSREWLRRHLRDDQAATSDD